MEGEKSMATITISIDGCELREIEEVAVTFKDGRPTTTYSKTRTDDEGNVITTTTISPASEQDRNDRKGGRRFEKKQAD